MASTSSQLRSTRSSGAPGSAPRAMRNRRPPLKDRQHSRGYAPASGWCRGDRLRSLRDPGSYGPENEHRRPSGFGGGRPEQNGMLRRCATDAESDHFRWGGVRRRTLGLTRWSQGSNVQSEPYQALDRKAPDLVAATRNKRSRR
jgi:hypothetical protein